MARAGSNPVLNDSHAIGDAARVPLVTIGMPVYNGARYLEEAVRSVQAQTERNFVLHISDNCSTDETSRICERLAQQDSRIHYSRQATNIGASRNFEFLIRTARSPYFCWAADDDTRTPDFLQKALDVLRSNPDAVGCAVGINVVNEAGERIRYVAPPKDLASPSAYRRARAVRAQGHFAIYGLLSTPRLPRDLAIPELFSPDGIFVHRLAMEGKLVTTPEPLLNYLLRPAESNPRSNPYEIGFRWRETHWAMLADSLRANIPFRDKALIASYLLYLELHDSHRIAEIRRREAHRDGRRVGELLQRTKQSALGPVVVLRKVSQKRKGG